VTDPARTVFFGSGGFAVPILEALLDAPEIHLAAVVTAPDRPVGRDARLMPPPVGLRAAEAGLQLLQPERLRSPDAIGLLSAVDARLGVLADYGKIVPPEVLRLFPSGILNVHPSLLPRHRGATPIPATILAGDSEAGVTVIRMDEGLDTGPIVAQTRWALSGRETAPELEARAATEGAQIVLATLADWLAGRIEVRPQTKEGATLTRPLRREDGRLRPELSAWILERQVRAYQPWPGSWFETVAGRVVVWGGEAIAVGGSAEDRESAPTPGEIGPIGLATADGWLGLDEVQLASGRRMSWPDLLRGHPGLVGSSIGS
jgi:methionyl-tRNA formyltransferase